MLAFAVSVNIVCVCLSIYICIHTLGTAQLVSDHLLVNPKMFENPQLRMIKLYMVPIAFALVLMLSQLYPQSYSNILVIFVFVSAFRAHVCFMD